MRTRHLLVGWLALAAFIATGIYMAATFPAPALDDMGRRIMYRSAHVYIIFSGLLNLLIAAWWTDEGDHPPRHRLRVIGSWLMLAAPAVFLAAFFFEPPRQWFMRPISLAGLAACMAGVFMHLRASKRGGRAGLAR